MSLVLLLLPVPLDEILFPHKEREKSCVRVREVSCIKKKTLVCLCISEPGLGVLIKSPEVLGLNQRSGIFTRACLSLRVELITI